MNVSEWIVQELINRGVTHVFTLQGGFSGSLNDAMGHSKLKPIYMLTESGAAYAAAGWALYTGKIGVCVITSGLAQTNALSGVASAYSDYLPILVISGDINSDLIIKREINHLRQGGQQDVPINKIAQSITKTCITIMYPETLCIFFNNFWKRALTKPMGSVWLNIPLNIQKEEMPND